MLLTSVSRQNHLWNWILNPELPLVVVWPLQACVHYPLIKNKRKYFRSSLIHTNLYIQIQLTLHNHECRKEGGDCDLFWHYHQLSFHSWKQLANYNHNPKRPTENHLYFFFCSLQITSIWTDIFQIICFHLIFHINPNHNI